MVEHSLIVVRYAECVDGPPRVGKVSEGVMSVSKGVVGISQ